MLLRTSLVIQWLALHALNAGAWARSLVGELDPAYCHTKIPRGAADTLCSWVTGNREKPLVVALSCPTL